MRNVTDSMMKVIGVKFVPPTNTRGARVKAFAKWENKIYHQVSLPWDYSIDNSKNYCKAARELADKLLWEGDMIGGAFGQEYVFVFGK